MAKKKKNDSKDKTLQTLVFATAILNFIRAVVDLVDRLLE